MLATKALQATPLCLDAEPPPVTLESLFSAVAPGTRRLEAYFGLALGEE